MNNLFLNFGHVLYLSLSFINDFLLDLDLWHINLDNSFFDFFMFLLQLVDLISQVGNLVFAPLLVLFIQGLQGSFLLNEQPLIIIELVSSMFILFDQSESFLFSLLLLSSLFLSNPL